MGAKARTLPLTSPAPTGSSASQSMAAPSRIPFLPLRLCAPAGKPPPPRPCERIRIRVHDPTRSQATCRQNLPCPRGQCRHPGPLARLHHRRQRRGKRPSLRESWWICYPSPDRNGRRQGRHHPRSRRRRVCPLRSRDGLIPAHFSRPTGPVVDTPFWPTQPSPDVAAAPCPPPASRGSGRACPDRHPLQGPAQRS